MLLKDSRSENWDSVSRVRNCKEYETDTRALQLFHEARLDQTKSCFFYIYIYIHMYVHVYSNDV